MIRRSIVFVCVILAAESLCFGSEKGTIFVFSRPARSLRVEFGMCRLVQALGDNAFECKLLEAGGPPKERPLIVVGNLTTGSLVRQLVAGADLDVERVRLGDEGFVLLGLDDGVTVVAGKDDSGTLYGCLALASKIRDKGEIPKDLHIKDAPAFHLRGPCIGMQKTYLLPGWGQYNYPYTPKLFPFFYDKAQWLEFLDFLVENRMNCLYLWNGHPFSSLVRVPGYPDALDVSEEVFRQNQDVFRFLTTEADRRGIWIIQMFYNIHFPKNLAEKYGVATEQSKPTQLNMDYTRKAIAEFVKTYPHVGLLTCLGEALSGDANKKRWLTDVIIPGVREGMQALNLTEEPPIIVREHTMQQSAAEIIGAGLKKYKNLYTMMKYNGEALTTARPRGPWAKIHRNLSSITSQHISNVHILANLEPFRYGATRFIQRCTQAMRNVHHANGLHLYPLSYWDWPISPDGDKIKQYKRDWIWFAAWARYSWDPDRPVRDEDNYWTDRLEEYYGSRRAAAQILDAYNQAGMCAPLLLRRFGITNGNRQTLSLGMTLDQLVRPEKYRIWPRLIDSDSPPGERLQEYVKKEWEGEAHTGETQPQVIRQVLDSSKHAVEAIEKAAPDVRKNQEEFARLRNDIHCIRAMTQFYAAKAQAAMCVLRHQYSQETADLLKARSHLKESLKAYRELVRLTENSYRYANSLQTATRRVPFNGSGGKYKHWVECLPVYEKEFAEFSRRIEDAEQ